MSALRILHLDSGREMRGGQWQVLRLIEGLLAAGHHCTLLAPPASPLETAARERGWKVAPLTFLRVAREARRHDLVHAHDAHSHTLAAIAGGALLVVSRRVAFPARTAWKYRRAARYIAVSKYVARILQEAGVAADKIAVVYDGVPLLPESTVERKCVLAPDNLDDPLKGSAVTAAAAELAEIQVCYSADLENDLPGAALFVYVTHVEGLGSAVLLAMSAGTPVVASNLGGLTEIVSHRETGLLVDNTPHAVARAIRELLEQPAFARRLAERARARVAEEFSVARMIEGTLEVYRRVLP